MKSSVLEDFINATNPSPLDLSQFFICVSRIPSLSEAPVRTVNCYRCGIHEYLIIACEVLLPSTGRLATVWFRLERNPKQKSLRVLTGKPDPAADTIKTSTRFDLLHSQGQSRGQFVYYTTETSRQTLKLIDVLRMCDYFGQKSPSYALFKTNCRWLCFALFECLKQCQPCYGGQCMAPKLQGSWSQHDVQAVTEAKNGYLRENHPACCIFQQPNLAFDLMLSEPVPAPASSAAVTPSQPHVNHIGSQFPSSPNTRLWHSALYHEGYPTADGFDVPQSPGGCCSPHPHHMHSSSGPFPQHRLSQVPSSQTSFDPHYQYRHNSGAPERNDSRPYPPSRRTRVETGSSYACGGYGASTTCSPHVEHVPDIPLCRAEMYRSSTYAPSSTQFPNAPRGNWNQPQPTYHQAPMPPSSHRTAPFCPSHHMSQPAPVSTSQTPLFNHNFSDQMFAHGQMPVGGRMGPGVSDHHRYSHMYMAPQPQPAGPTRSWTEKVWDSTTGPPPRTDSPGTIDTCRCGQDCAGGKHFPVVCL